MKKFLFVPMLVSQAALSQEDRQKVADDQQPPIAFLAFLINPNEVAHLMSVAAQAASTGLTVATANVRVEEAYFLTGDEKPIDEMAERIAKELGDAGLNNATPVWVDDADLAGERKSVFSGENLIGIQFTCFNSGKQCGLSLVNPDIGDICNSAAIDPQLLLRNAPEEVELLEPLKVLAAGVGSNMLREGSGGDGNFDISGAIDITDEGDFWVHGRVFVDRSLVDENIDQLKEAANADG